MSRRPVAHAAPHAIRTIAVLAALGSLAFDGAFRGCGGESDPPGSSLPMGEPPECLVDSDCVAPMCSDAACVAGHCTVSPVTIDDDRDGVIAAPCGPDCDDGNPLVYPLAFEDCDGVDNDCDAIVDEGATTTPVSYEIGTQVLGAGAFTDLPGVLLVSADFDPSGLALVARWFDLGPGGAVSLATLEPGVGPDTVVATVAVTDGLQVIWSHPTDRVIRTATVTTSAGPGGVVPSVGPVEELAADIDVVALRASPTATGYAVLVERVTDTGERARELVVPGATSVPLGYGDAPLDLAGRDVRLYTPSGPAEIAVLDASGMELTRVRLPGDSAEDAVASWNGRILAPSADLSDYTLREITPADTLGDGWPLRTGGFSGDIGVHPMSDTLAVTRTTSGLDLALYDSSFEPTEIFAGLVYSSTGRFDFRTVLETSVGPALVATRGGSGGAAVVAFACRPDTRLGP